MKSSIRILSIILLIILLNINIHNYVEIVEGENVNQKSNQTIYLEDRQWSMYNYDLKHTGQNPNALYENPMRLRWKTKLYASIGYASPIIIDDGSIIIGTAQNHPDITRKLYSIFPNGTINWSFNLNQGTLSSPAIDSNGNIILGTSGNAGAYDARLYSIYSNGSMRWEYKFESPTISSPVIVMANIYIGSMGGKLYSFSENGTLNWIFSCDDSILSSPAIDDFGIIYFGSEDSYVYALYPNGSLKWKYQTAGEISSSACISSEGIIYIESRADHGLYALYPNGSLKWKFDTTNIIHSSSIDQNGNIFFGSDDNNLYSLHPNGTLRWRYSANNIILGPPAIDGLGNIYFGSRDYYLYYLNNDGDLIWKYRVDSGIESSPTIDNNGNVYIGSFEGYLYSIGALAPSKPRNPHIGFEEDHTSIGWSTPADNGSADIEGYRIYRKGVEGYFSMISELGPSIRSYEDSDVLYGTNYSYYIIAFNREGEGGHSILLKITPLCHPDPPIDVNCTRETLQNNISWSPPDITGGTAILRYLVHYSDDNTSFTILGTTNDTFYIHPVSEVGKVYYYYIEAENEVGIGFKSLQVSSIPIGPPLGRPMVTVSIQNASIVFRLDPPYDNGGAPITHYTIHRDGFLLDEIPFDSAYYNDTDLINGEVHAYEFYAVNMAGNSEVTGPIELASSRTPYRPQNFSAVSKNGHITLSWDPPEDDGGMPILGYAVCRWMENGWDGTGWHRMMILNDTSWTDTIVEEGVIYQYYVEAFNNRGAGDWSQIITINNTELFPPSVPRNVEVYLVDDGISITWDKPESQGSSPITNYMVFRKVEGSGDFIQIGSTPQTSFLNTNISSFTTYHYHIYAVSEAGLSNVSETVTLEVGDLTKIQDPDPGNNSDVKFPWAIAITIFISLLVIIAIVLIAVKMKKRNRDDDEADTNDEISILDDIENVVIEGQESDFPGEKVDEPEGDQLQSPQEDGFGDEAYPKIKSSSR